MKKLEEFLFHAILLIMCITALVLVSLPALSAFRCFPVFTEEKQPDGSKIFRSRDKKCYYVEDEPIPSPSPSCSDNVCPRR